MTDTRRPSPTLRADATRDRLLALLREGTWTVDALAERLGVTNNAVRFHLDAFERSGTVRKEGVRRIGGAGQPASLYSLSSGGEEAFSRAYASVLIACLEELRDRTSGPQVVAFLKRVGKRLAGGFSLSSSGSLSSRVSGASDLLNALGGITSVEKLGTTYRIVGRACPLSRAVEADHCVCAAVTSLVAEVVGAEVRERCDRSGRPKCCFEISSDHGARTTAHG